MLQFLLLGTLFVLLSAAVYGTHAAYQQDQYAALEPGQGGNGSAIAVHEAISVIMCAFR